MEVCQLYKFLQSLEGLLPDCRVRDWCLICKVSYTSRLTATCSLNVVCYMKMAELVERGLSSCEKQFQRLHCSFLKDKKDCARAQQ